MQKSRLEHIIRRKINHTSYVEVTNMIVLVDQNVRRAIISLLHRAKKVEENMTVMRRKMEDVTKIQIKLAELRNTIPKTKVHCIELDTAEEKIMNSKTLQ